MNSKIDNLINYFKGIFHENNNKNNGLSRMVNKKAMDIKEDEFKKFITKFSWASPVDILIMSISYIEKIKENTNIKNCNKFGILWIVCILSTKYIYSHDNEQDFSMEFLANLGGFQLEDYKKLEIILLKKLGYRLEISVLDYNRLIDVSNLITVG
jgi:hypothetical protein